VGQGTDKVSYVKRLRDRLTFSSKVRYLAWRAGIIGDEVEVSLDTGERILLHKSIKLGLAAAYEIFVIEGYRCPRELSPDSVHRIVDVGANVGYSLIYWTSRFPFATIDAFEPHPGHLEILRRSLRMNRIDERIRLHSVAVGIAKGTSELVDAGTASAVANDNAALRRADFGRFQVDVVDFFDSVNGIRIDLLKLDCEGAEYSIVMDPRFGDLDVSNLVMEWHATQEHPQAQYDLAMHLRDLGWEIEPGAMENVKTMDGLGLLAAGVFWGFRR
jgi:FkbM family methyltransferase